MFFELATLDLKPCALGTALERLEPLVCAPRLLGCWYSVLGHRSRIFVLMRQSEQTDHEQARRQAVANQGLMSIADVLEGITIDTWSTLPCLPDIATGAFGSIYEFRFYDLHPMSALEAAYKGWAAVIQSRLDLAPITTVMHSVSGRVPRLLHVYPYRDLQHRQEIRVQAIGTGLWPPKGGAARNQVMAAEIAVPAVFSPIH